LAGRNPAAAVYVAVAFDGPVRDRPVLSKIMLAVEPLGLDVNTARRVTSSPVSKDAEVNPAAEAKAVPTLPTAGAAIDTAVTSAASPSAAFEGIAESNPKPKAETATSAIRLRVVFVDICFLSLVVKKTFSFTAGKERLFAS
jgi:hypothetical protein